MGTATRLLAPPSLRIRNKVLRMVVLLVLAFAGAILLVTTLSANKAVRDLSHSAIDHSVTRTGAELGAFFDPIEANLLMARDWGQASAFDLDDHQALNRRFVPMLQQHQQITSMLIGNSKGEEWLLLRDGDTWRNRLSRADEWDGHVKWVRWSDDLLLIQEEDKSLAYDTRKRPWHEGAVAGDGKKPVWTPPYTFFTTQDPGITTSIKWQQGDTTWVIAFDLMLIDISAFTTGLDVSPNGKVIVLTDDNKVMGLPADARYDNRDAFKPYVLMAAPALGIPELDAGLAAWSQATGTFRFSAASGTWWGSFRPFSLGANRTFHIGVIVPEDDFRALANSQRNLLVLITLLGLLAAIVLAFVLDQAFELHLAREVEKVRQLGQYTLQEKLGEGGMGAVYKASHAMLRRPTAIKLLHAERASDEAELVRFEQEVQLTSSLSHPNTIAIYDYGRTPEDIFYYAMEYVEGTNLEDLVQGSGQQPADRVIHILMQACGSLDEAHHVGLVHRDVKPANIMLCRRGGIYDTVKVLDFGLVTELTPADGDTTNPQGIIGTPRYMSPESIQNPAMVDRRTDIYALGLIGAYLLTGKHLFDSKTTQAICAMQLFSVIDSLRELESSIPEDLERVLLACMHKDPADRPATAADLARQLAACADAGRWTDEQARGWWQEHTSMKTLAMPSLSQDTMALTVNLER